MTDSNSNRPRPGVSRRGWLAGVATAAALTPVARAAGSQGAANAAGADADTVDLNRSYPFYGTGGQAGIQTTPQRHAMYMTFDLTTTDRDRLQLLLARWSAAIAQMMQAKPMGPVEPSAPQAVGPDSGEALDLSPASLTVTVGLGPRVFGPEYGLAGRKPTLMRELRTLPSDAFDPALTGGDLSLQACADDPQVTYHAIRDLARIAKVTGTAATKWTVLGFGRASAGPGQGTQRNLLGFKDGTRNVQGDAEFEKFVWINAGPDWQRHGTFQVVRKIRMHIENWDVDRIGDQNTIFGRHKLSGAPLTGAHEFDVPDFQRRDAAGGLVIAENSHIALAAFENNDGLKILRRPYNYTDGINSVGLLDAGLLFISYQNDPEHFERLQERLGASDLLNEYIEHIGSAIFYIPPRAAEGGFIGQSLFV